MYLNILDLDKTAYHVWNVVRIIQRRVSKTQGLLCTLLLPLVLVISLNEVHASRVPVTDPGHNSNIKSPEIPQPPQPPFDIYGIVEKAEHLVQRDPKNADHYLVQDPTYRIKYTPRGITYVPVIGGEISPNSFSFKVSQIGMTSGEVFWNNNGKDNVPLIKENTVTYSYTPHIEELYENLIQGVEQSWILKSNPGINEAADLRITINVETALKGRATVHGGLEFVDHKGNPHIRYSKAIIFDAKGDTIEVASKWDAGESDIVLEIPGKWLATATYPVVVDPVLNTADISVPDTPSATTDESYPAVAFDGTTNYLVVYQSGTPLTAGTGTTDIKGVRVNASTGAIVDATPITIVATASRDEEHPAIAYDPSYNGGSFLVVWETWQTSILSDIWLTVVKASDGTVGGASFPVKISGNNTQRIMAYPSIACCDGTNAYAVWARSGQNNGNRLYSVRGALVNKTNPLTFTAANPTAGTLTNAAGPTSDPTTAPSLNPEIIFTNTTVNKYFLVFEDYPSTSTTGDLKANLYTVGTGWGATPWSIAATGGMLERYAVPSFDGTNLLVVYQRGATGGSADIYGQFATTAGVNLANPTSPFAISAQATIDETVPGLAWVSGTCTASPVNRYLAVWVEGTAIKASPVTSAGGLETAITVSVNTASTKVYPVVTSYEGGCGYFVAWSDNRNGGGNPYDIFAQRVGYPSINDLGPNSGPVGTTISINGNFGNDPGAGNRSAATNNVKLNGVPLLDSDITSWSNMTINFVIPTGAALGTYPVAVTSGSWNTNSSNLTVTTPPLQITTGILPYGHQWLPYTNTTLTASGGTPPYSNWQIVLGALPDGLTLNPATGEISGTPTGIEASETVNFTVQVSDSVPNVATKALSITVYKLASITITDVGGTPVSPNIYDLQTYQFKAWGTYSDISQSDVSNISALQWKSSNVNIATINATGLATGVAPGTATICAVTANEACP